MALDWGGGIAVGLQFRLFRVDDATAAFFNEVRSLAVFTQLDSLCDFAFALFCDIALLVGEVICGGALDVVDTVFVWTGDAGGQHRQ